MSILQIKIAPWDKTFEIDLSKKNKKIKEDKFQQGDYLVIKIGSHTDLGKIVNIVENGENNDNENYKESEETEEISIIRKVNDDDLEKAKDKEKKAKEILNRVREIIKKSGLPMKLVDIHLSLDGGKMIIAFVAAERIDFRDLVKNLSQEFRRSIRLHQINPREEIKVFSGIGSCGYSLCCLNFLKTLGGVKTNLIEEQQLQHRGVDRLSGPCGRLKCCLAFEKDFYQEQIKKMPPIGQKIKIKGKVGKIIGWHILKGNVDVKFEKEETIIEVDINDIKNI